MIDTPLSRQGLTPEITAKLLAESPIGRMGQPAEVASAVLWLSDPGSSFLTGQAVAVDGAWTAR
jgi:NAD(P)-dependent dehydrogenase (short-subunit alcohol dehydrogenase family)